MVIIARWIGFIMSSVWIEVAHGLGLVALLLAVLIGYRRMRAFWLVVPVLGGALAAHGLFGPLASGGKIDAALSNIVFLLLIYVLIALIGYGIGALLRAWRT